MSLKAELEIWANALKAYDEEDFDRSLDLFSRIAESSKILTNMGLIYATLGEHELAVEQFNAATGLDKYLAVAYFQCGVSNFLLGRYPMAHKDFEEALLYLRGNQAINYEQLGLKFKLFSAEVLFNKGLCMIYMNNFQAGMDDLESARQEKVTEEHGVIDDAIADRGEGYTVFSVPVGIVYRPSENKLRNAKTKDYLGKAKLVAASDASDAYTTFTGVTRLQQGVTPSGTRIDTVKSNDPNSLPLPRAGSDISRPSATERLTVIPPDRYNQRMASNNNSPVSPQRDRGEGTAGGRSRAVTVPENRSPMTVGLPLRSNTMGGARPGRDREPRADTPPTQDGESVPPPPVKSAPSHPMREPQPSRLTEVYDDLLEGYTQSQPEITPGSGGVPPMPAIPEGNKRIQAWARGAGGAPPPTAGGMERMGTPSRSMSMRAPSSYGGGSGGSMRRRNTNRAGPGGRGYGSSSRATSRVVSAYDVGDEDDGYRSAEYEEPEYEFSKIRVKIHYKDDIRGIVLDPSISFDEFVDRLTSKFETAFDGLTLRFKDDEGGKVSLRDESDYELAIETAKENAQGRAEGKLEIWCDDR